MLRRCGVGRSHSAHCVGFKVDGVDGADDGGRRDHERKLPVELPGDAGQEGGRQEDRHEHERDPQHRAGQLVHGLDGGFLGCQALLDAVGRALDDHDGVVHHDADGEGDQGEEGHHVHGKPHGRHGDEGADDGDGHRGGRNEGGPPVLQEDHDDQQHQDRGLVEGLVHLMDGGPGELVVVSKGIA